MLNVILKYIRKLQLLVVQEGGIQRVIYTMTFKEWMKSVTSLIALETRAFKELPYLELQSM